MNEKHWHWLWNFWWGLAIEARQAGNYALEDVYRETMKDCNKRAAAALGLREIR